MSGNLMERVMTAAEDKSKSTHLESTMAKNKLHLSKDELVDRVQKFVNKHGAVRQRTREWYELMQGTIGGSELATIIGKTPKKYGTRSQLAEKKKGNGSAKQECSIYCAWGNLFEPIVRTYSELAFDTKIYGHDICIKNDQFRFSPDGLGVVPRRRGCEVFDIVLFEFKCPYYRDPKGKVLERYIPQVLSGLAATEEIEPAYGMFVDAVCKICRVDQLDWTPDYNREYHSEGYPYQRKPIAYGFFNLYANCGDRAIVGKVPFDYGSVDKSWFDEILMKIDGGIDVKASLVYLTFADINKPDILNGQCHPDEGMGFLGVIPFKLIKVCHSKVKPEPGYGEYVAKEVKRFFRDVNKI